MSRFLEQDVHSLDVRIIEPNKRVNNETPRLEKCSMPNDFKKQLVLTLGVGADVDDEELDELSRQRRSELVALGVEVTNPVSPGKALRELRVIRSL